MRDCLECGGQWPDGTQTCPDDGSMLVAEGADPYLNQPVGSYVVTRCLGRGGMGAVYEAQHPTIGSRVAVKFLHRRYATDQGIVDRFFNEARAVNVIGHDNIVKVSDFDRMPDGSPYFIMEFLDGRPLTALVGPVQPLSIIGPIFLQVAEGLLAAHEKGIIHRDLKPDNIYLVNRGRRGNFVKIVDFGIAKLQGPDSSPGRTRTGMVMGTAQYMSPEQAGGEVNRISAASDVYSLGVIMFQLATGRLPFDGNSFGDILVGHLVKEPPSPRSLEPSVPEAYEALILRCLAKKPEDRFSDMEQFFDALGEVLDGEGLSRDLPLAQIGARSDPGSAPAVFKPLSAPPRAITGAPTDEEKGHTRMATPSQPGSTGTQVLQGGGTGTVMLGAPATFVLDRRNAEPKRPVGAIVAIVAVVVLAGAGGAWFMLRQQPAVAPPPRVAAPAPAPTPPPPPAPTQVAVTIVTTPAGATVSLTQGEKTHDATTPATLKLKPNTQAKVRLSAEGFESLTAHFTPEKATELNYALTALPPPEPEPVVRPKKRRPPARRPEPVTAAAKPEEKKTPPKSVGDGIVEVDF